MWQEVDVLGKSYAEFLQELKKEIGTARTKAHLAVNSELIKLYWRIGKSILDRQKSEGWGAKVIDQLSRDLRYEFDGAKGFSTRNLNYMRLFAEEYPQEEFMQQVAAQLPWFHHCVLLDKVKSYEERCWYIQKTAENGWSRNVLTLQIENKLYHRQGKAITNFKATLPAIDSDFAQEIFKSTYNLEFLSLEQHTKERTLEKALVSNIRDFLLELGTGFAFMGNQYKVVIEDEEFFIDLLFYNTRLRCYVVIELKVGKFLPEYAGKLGVYLTLIDRRMKHTSDNPTIGIILCQSAKDVVVEYSLSGSTKPMGVSQYQVGTSLPKEFDDVLPSPEALKSFLSRVNGDEGDE